MAVIYVHQENLYAGNSSPMLIACRPVEKAIEDKKRREGRGQNNLVKLWVLDGNDLTNINSVLYVYQFIETEALLALFLQILT